MKILKGILTVLVVLFIIILGVGGYLIGYNQNVGNSAPQHPDTEAPPAHSQPVQEKERLVPVIVGREQVAPEQYLRDMEQALDLIREATNLITNEPYMTMVPLPGDPDGAGSGTPPQMQISGSMEGMGKIHQGIYKIAQGITIMDMNMKGMGQEIKTARENNISYYEIPGQQNYKLYLPYNPYNPYYYGGGYAPAPQPGQQGDPGSHVGTGQPAGHGTPAQPYQGLTSLFSVNTLVYIIYGVLFLSVIGGIVGVLGFLASLFKAPTQGRDTYAG